MPSLPTAFSEGVDRLREFREDVAERLPSRVTRFADRAPSTLRDAASRAPSAVSAIGHLIGERRSWAVAGAAVAGFAAAVMLLSGRKIAMQATTAVTGDWFAQLKAEHRQVEALFKACRATSDSEVAKRTALYNHIAYALLKHGLQEETVIYPALRDMADDEASKHLASEHFDIKTHLHRLSEMDKADPKWLKKLTTLEALVMKHVREEEEELFPRLHAALSKETNAHLTKAMNREGIKLA